jgi:uncharacterized protein (DUF433 family)
MAKAKFSLVLVLLLFTIPAFPQSHAIPRSFPFLYKCDCHPGGIGEALMHSFAKLLTVHSEYRIPSKGDQWFLQIETSPRGKPFKMSNGYSAELLDVVWEHIDILHDGSLKTTAVTAGIYAVTNAPASAMAQHRNHDKNRQKVSDMATLDWSKCSAVESVPGRLGGAWVFRDTRMPVSAVFENLESGASIDEIADWFHLERSLLVAVLDFAARSLETHPFPAQQAPPAPDAHTF